MKELKPFSHCCKIRDQTLVSIGENQKTKIQKSCSIDTRSFGMLSTHMTLSWLSTLVEMSIMWIISAALVCILWVWFSMCYKIRSYEVYVLCLIYMHI